MTISMSRSPLASSAERYVEPSVRQQSCESPFDVENDFNQANRSREKQDKLKRKHEQNKERRSSELTII